MFCLAAKRYIGLKSKIDTETALELLGFHSSRDPRVNDRRWKTGFLSTLRPYRGIESVEQAYHEIMACLKAIIDLCEADMISRDLANDLAGITALGRAWGCHPDGMLKRNNIITPIDAEKLESMIDSIAYTWCMLLDGQVDIAFVDYDQEYATPKSSA